MTEEPTAEELEAAKEETAKLAAEKEVADKKAAEEEEALKNDPDAKREAYLKRQTDAIKKAEDELAERKADLEAFNPESGGDNAVDDAIARRFEIQETVDAYVEKYPGLKEDREKMLKYALHPSRKGIPIEEVVAGAVGLEKMASIITDMKKAADEEANEQTFGGSSPSKEEQSELDKTSEKYEANPPKWMKPILEKEKANQ